VALGLAQEQSRLGHRATVWFVDSPSEMDWVQESYSNSLSNIQAFPPLGPRQIGYSPVLEKTILHTEKQNFDILHQHSIWMANSRATNRWRKKFKRPTVIAPHGTLEEYALDRSAWKKKLAAWAYESHNLAYASCLHALSEAEAISIRRYGLINPIAIIPNGLPEDWISRKGNARQFRAKFHISSEKRILLFLSRLHPKKGLPFLIESAHQLSDRLTDWQILIAGPDENGYRREIELLSAKLGTSKLIKFIGPVFGDEKADAFASSDLLVLPTLSEGAPVVVLEALGAGVPVITTHGTPWRELESEQCGWWVDVSVEGIRTAMLEAIHLSKNELREMGERGRKLVARKYSLARNAGKTILLYGWLCGTGERPDFVVTD